MLLALICLPAFAEVYDPMRPPAYALQKMRLEKSGQQTAVVPQGEKKPAPWVLNSILYSSQRQHAIINNKIIKKGDTINGAKLISLTPDSVRLIKQGKIIQLRINSEYQSVKKIHAGKTL